MNQSKRNTTTIRPEPWWLRTFRIFFLFVFVLGNMFQGLSPTRVVQAVGEAPMQTYFLSMPEDQVRTPFVVLDTGRNRIGNTMVSITSIATTVNGTIIYYDQWEDGYEALSTTPAQSSTLVFGDGNTANGNACTYAQPASLCSDDVLTSGAVLVLRNNVPSNPRGTGTYFDARDKLATTQVVAVTRAMWDSNTGTVLAGALQVYDTSGYGIDFRLPVGENVSASAMFDYAGLFVMAANDGTTVSIDSDGDGDTDYTSTLSAGGAYFLSSATSGVTLNSNARITSNLPIQVNLITGDINNNEWYENRWFNIPPLAMLGSSYVTPVSSMSNSNSNVFIYNPNQSSAITVYAQTGSGTTSFSVAARGTYRYVMPTGSGARFYTNNGAVFMAIGTNDSPAVGNNGDSAGASWDWGYTLIAEELLAPSLAVGWAPGNSNVPLTTENGSPVWVSAAAATTIYVDYDGNPATGTYTDVNGNHYDTSYTVTALQSIRIYDPDDNQTAMRVYTVDGTLLAATWGEDTSEAGTGTPYLDMGYVIFPLPQMVLTKDGVLDVTIVTPLDQANAGDVVHYTLVATNNGTRTLTNVTIVDPKLGTLACTPTQPATLASGASMTCTGNYTLTQADIDAGVVYNSAIGDSNQTPPTTVQEEVKIPLLSVIKTASPTSVPETGGSVTFTFTVKNNNSVASGVSLVILTLSDTVYGTLAGDSDCQVGTVLAPQASCDFSITRTVSGDAELGGSHTNKFTAVAEDAGAGNDPDVSASDNEIVTFTDVDPAIEVKKYVSIDGGLTWVDADEAPGPYLGSSGSAPQFRFVVTNTGPVALSNVTVTDTDFTLPAGCIVSTLAVGASDDCIVTGTWAAAQHANTATASGGFIDGAGNTETATDTDDAHYYGAIPSLTLVKTASPANYTAEGQMISYSYTVTNNGNIPIVGPVTVTDDKATVTCPPGGLAVGADMTCTATYTIEQADLDAGSVKNTARAHADGIDSNYDDETVTATQSPALSLIKSATPGTYDTVGQDITYSYTIKNTGNVTLSGPFSVNDNKATVTCTQPADGALSPNEEMSCTATYDVTQGDLDGASVTNKATATNGTVTSNEATATVYAEAKPNLGLVKTASPAEYDSVGDVISYSYVVTNIGNVAVRPPYAVTDNKASVTCPQTPNPLPVGSSITCTASYTIGQADLDAGSVTNEATASATFGDNPVTSNKAQATVNADQNRALDLDKTATPETYDEVGDVISYSYLVTNAGNITLHDPITVSDNKALVTCPALPVGGLAPGAFITCAATYTIQQTDLDAGLVTNKATASDGTVSSEPDSETVEAVQSPVLVLDKTASPATYDGAGDIITYDYALTNSGNVTLSGPFTVGDDKATVTCPPEVTSLAVDDTLHCTAEHIVTQVEMDAGQIVNLAQAHALHGTTPVDSNEDTETVTAVKNPALTIVKTATPTTYDAVNDVISYSYLVTNSGNVTLYGITVVDDKATVTCPDTSAGLAPQGTITCNASYSIKQADLDAGAVTNTAYATDGVTQSEPDSETVNAIQQGGLGLKKSADPLVYDSVDNVITYTYTVQNTGNITLSGPFTVNDDIVGAVSCPEGSLAPLATVTCTASYTIGQADLDAGSVTNIASATDGTLISNPATATVTAVQNPALSFDKSAVETGYNAADQVIHYEYLVTNSGNVTLHAPITVSDDKAIDEYCPALPDDGLAPGASIICTATYTTQQSDVDAGSLTNIASATDGTLTTPTDTVTIPATRTPELTLAKSANPLTYTTLGQEITYDYLLTNSGNVTLSAPFAVLDDKATVTCPEEVEFLAPTQTLNCTATYSITQADLDNGSVTNTADATAKFGETTVPSNQDTATVEAVQNPELTLVKTANPSTYDAAGDTISYSYVVTNSGNVTLSGPFSVADDKSTNESCPATASLIPGASITCTATYAITQGDMDSGSVTNTAQAKGAFKGSDVLSNFDAETVNAVPEPALSLVKSADPVAYDHVGQEIDYTYVLKNIGNVTLAGPFTVTDDKITGLNVVTCPNDATLAVGAELICTATYLITQADLDAGSVVNIATGHAQTLGGTPVNSNNASATVNAVPLPALTIVKTATPTTYDAVGDVIAYSYLVTNSGNVTLHAPIVVSDDRATDEWCPALPAGGLAPGQSITCTASYTIALGDLNAGSVTNTASAASGATVSPTDDETVTGDQNPHLSLTKAAGETNFNAAGQTLHYTLVATNDGNVTLTGVSISDPKLGELVCSPEQPASLAPTEKLTCTGTYVTTQDDVDAGKVDNTANAAGQFGETPVPAAPASESVPAVQSPAILVVKSSTTTAIVEAGQVVPYTFLVSNDGNLTLSGITVSDPNCDAAPVYVEGDANTDGKLQIGETWTYGCNHTVTQVEIDTGGGGDGDLDNTVTVDSVESGPDSDDHEIDINYAPAMTVVKSSTTASLSAPATVTYDYLVTNTGNVTLTGIVLSDNNDEDDLSCPANTLAVGASMTCTATHEFTQAELDAGGKLDNTVTADSAETMPVTDDLSIPITRSPAMTVEKSSATTSLNAPATVTYEYQVTNTGNTTLTGIALSDNNDNDDMSCPATELVVGASMTCTATHTFTQAELDAGGTLDNTVTADSAQTEPVIDNLSIPISQSGVLTVEKSSTTTSLSAPGTVTYSYVVTNTGNVTLTDIVLSDNNIDGAVSCPATTLAVGVSMTCSATHTFTQAELDANGSPTAGSGVLYNVVTADSAQTEPVTGDLSIPITQSPAMTVEKTSQTVLLSETGTVTYNYLVTNTGNLTLTGIVLSDNNDEDDMVCESDTLVVGASINCSATHVFTQDELDANGSPTAGSGVLYNVVTADSNETGPATDDLSITIDQNQGIIVVKASTTVEIVEAGQVVPYTFTVSNPGNVTLTGVTVSDPMCDAAPVYVSGDANEDDRLQRTETWTFTCDHTVTQVEIDTDGGGDGDLDNTVTADSNESEPDTDVHSIPIDYAPAMTVAKSSTTASLSAPATVTYSYLVTNTGNTTLTGIVLSDDNDNDDMVCPFDTLAVGANMTCHATHTFTQDELDAGGTLDNIVTADSAETEPVTDNLSIPITRTPVMTVVKSSTTTSLSAPATVTYSYLVTNTGNVTLTGIALSDNNDNNDMSCPATELAVGETMTCTATHTFTQAELDAGGTLDNVVTASSNEAPDATDDLSIPITQDAGISLVKSGTFDAGADGFANVGELISYEFLVTNTGNTTLTGIAVTDPKVSPINCPATTLAVGASMTCTGTYAVTQADIDAGQVVNLASADSNETPPAEGGNTEELPQYPAIQIIKGPELQKVDEGATVTFDITVTNIGNVSLTNVDVTDALAPDCNRSDLSLAVGESFTYTCTAVANADFTNVAVVTGSGPQQQPVSDDDDAVVDVLPTIAVSKLANPATVDEPGADVTFTVNVLNTSPEDVTLTSLVDNIYGDLDGVGTCDVPVTIAAGATYSCAFTQFVSGNAGSSHTNIVSGTANDNEGNPAGDTGTATVTVSGVAPLVDLVKEVAPASMEEPGGPFTYTLTITNNSVEPVEITALTDTNALSPECTALIGLELPVAGSTSCTYTVTQTEAGTYQNTAEVTVIDNDGVTASDSDDASVKVFDVKPTVTLDKSVTPETLPEPGGPFTYTLTITNTSVEAVTITALTDTNALSQECLDLVGDTLAVNQSVSCQYTVPQTDDGTYPNTASVTVEDNEGNPASDEDTASVTVTDTLPAISVTKVASPVTLPEPGGVFTYTYVVTNTGTVPVTVTSVTDSVIGVITLPADVELLPDESTVAFTATWTYTDDGVYGNTVTALAVDDDGNEADATANAAVEVTDTLPEINVTKTGMPTTVPETGGDVSFTYVVENTGDVPVTITSLVDDKFGTLTGDVDCAVGTELAPDASCSFEATFAIPAGATGSTHVNVFTAIASDDDDNPATDTDDATITRTDVAPAISVSKVASPLSLPEPGGVFTYTYVVTNTGTVPVTVTSVTDSVIGLITLPADVELLPGESTAAFTATHTYTDDGVYPNTVTAVAEDADGNEANATASASVEVTDTKPAISVSKVADPLTMAEPGGVFTYTYVVTNTGAVPVTVTSVTDSVIGAITLPADVELLPGESTVAFTATHTYTDDDVYLNTVTALAVDDDGNEADATANASVEVTDTLPAISVTKVASPLSLPEPGGVFTYTYVVTNTGTVPVTVTSVTDSVIGLITLPADVELLPGESTAAFTATWTYTDDGVYPNTVTALAVDDDGNSASAEAAASVSVTDTAPTISVSKVASPLTMAEPGGVFTYTYVVTNTGAVPITVTSVTDSVIGAITLPADVELLPGESTAAFTATWTYTDDGVYGNTITALAVDDDGNQATAQADASVTVTDTLPEVSLVKTAAPLTLAEPGGAFTFTLLITNHSVEPVEITALTDDNPLPATCTNLIGTVLAANGGTATCSYPVTYTETGVYPNEASVSVTDDDDNIDSATDDASVEVTDVLPSVDLVKTASPLVLPEPGGVFTYTLEITNTSVEPVTINALTDDNALSQECLDLVGDTLAVGQKVTCHYTATFTNAGVYPNTAEVTVADNEGNPASDDDDASVEVTNTAPAIEVTKTASPTSVPETGGDVTFTFVVKNLSVEPVELTVLSDSVFGDLHGQGTCALPQSIAVSGEYTCAIIKFLSSDSLTAHTNVVTATAVDDDGTRSTDTDDETVTFTDVAPAILVTKSANPTSVPETGGLVEFTFMVENIGTEAVTITSLSDSVYGELEGDEDCEVDSVLPVDQFCAFSITRWVEGDFGAPDHVNVFTAVAVDNDRTTATDNDDATVAFNDVPPAIVVTKTASPTTLPETGGDVTFTFVVGNTGPEAVTLTSLVDDAFGDLNGQGTCATGGLIPVGGSYTCSITVFLASDSLAAHTNEVTAVGTDDDGTTATDDDDAIVTFTDVAPSIKVTKTADLTVLPETGGNVTFTFVVTNDGVEDVTLTSLTDSVFGNLNGQGDCVVPQTILISGSYTCSVTKFLAADDLTAHTNLVTAVGTDDDGTTDTATDDETVTFTDVAPAVKVTKTASPTHVPETGGNVTFTFVVENTGQEDVTLTELTDTVFGDLNGQGNCVVPQTIAIGDSYTCSVTKFLASDSLADHYNVTTATVVDDDNTPATGTDDETVTFDDVAPMIEVTKTASPTSVPETGTDVTFTFVVENTGQEDVTLTSLTDTVFGDLNGQGTCVTPQTILIGGSYTCQVTKFLAADDLQAHKNVVTGTVVDDDDTPATGTDDETVTFTDVAPAINVTKTASPTSVPETGADVTFTFLVENTGQEDVTLTSLTDSVFGDLNGQGTCVTPQTIVIGGSYGCTVTKFLASDSLIAHKNVVTASAVDDDGTTASDKDDETVTFNDVAPAIKVTKTASPTSVPETGANVTFTFLVQNTGLEDVTLNSLVDDVFGNLDGQGTCDLPQTIAVGGSYTCSVTKFLAADDLQAHKNVVTATAVDDDDTPATGTDDETVTFEDVLPVVDLTKSVDSDGTFNIGNDATYTLTIKNTSLEPVEITALTDTHPLPAECTDLIGTILQPGASASCSYTIHYDEAGTYENTATVTVEDGEGNSASDEDDQSVTVYKPVVSKTANGVYDEVHDWQVFKTVNTDFQYGQPGEKIDFIWTVRVEETTHGENYKVTGVITVANTNPDDPITLAISDVLDDGSVAAIGPCTNGTLSGNNLTVPGGNTATCNYSVTPSGDPLDFGTALPDQVTMSVEFGYANGPAYFPVTTITDGGALDGTYTGWCADIDRPIAEKTNYTAKVYSSLESLPAGLIENAQNLDLVNWIINQDYIGKSAGSTLGTYTYGDVQRAIWELIEDNGTASTAGLGSWSQKRVDKIKAAAISKGEGFMPTCGDFVAVIVQPTNGKQTVALAQVTFASLGINCADTNVVTAVMGKFTFKASADIVWTPNLINPTATLDDDHKLDWPITVDGDSTFTYQDPAGFTCSTDPSDYPSGYNRNIITNTAVLGFDTGSETATASTQVKCYKPVLEVVKTAKQLKIPETGGYVTYSFEVNNPGIGPLTITSLVDNRFGDLVGDDDCHVGIVLEHNTSCSFDATFWVPAGTAGKTHVNVVTAVGTDPLGNTATDTDDAVVTYLPVMPDISVTKTADKSSVAETGEDVTFTFVVKNTGLKTVTITSLSDSVFGTLSGDEDCKVGTVLEPGGSCEFALTKFIKGDCSGKAHYNVFTAKAKDSSGNIDTATDDEKVTFNGVAPSISVTKTASVETIAEPGGNVTFTFVVKNTGLESVKITSLTDSVFGTLAGSTNCKVGTSLAGGASCTFQITKKITGVTGDIHTNLFTAVAADNDGESATASDDATVKFTNPKPSLTVDKSVNPATITELGGEVTYTFVVKNTGTTALTISSLVDDKLGELAGDDDCKVGVTLEGGAYCSFDVTVALPPAKPGTTHVNVFTATATDSEGTVATDQDDALVKYTIVLPDISVTKTADKASVVETGEDVTFTFVVENIGLKPVVIKSLSDSVFGVLAGDEDCMVGTTLEVGGSCSFSITRFISGEAGKGHYNVFTAKAIDNNGNIDSASDDEKIAFTGVIPAITVTKTANPETLDEPGGKVTYTFVVSNTGDEALKITSLFDSVYGKLKGDKDCKVGITLAAGKSCSFTLTKLVIGDAGTVHNNLFTAQGKDNEGNLVEASDDATVTILDKLPTIKVEKIPSAKIAVSGSKIKFTVKVKNTSLEPVTLNSLVDDVFGDLNGQGTCSVPKTLKVGSTYTCYFYGVVTSQTTLFEASYHVNTVTAAAVDNENNTATGSATAKIMMAWRGRTPGYWKNHTSGWPKFSMENYLGQTVAIKTSTPVLSVFELPASLQTCSGTTCILDLDGNKKDDTLLNALSYKGGSTLAGKAQILLRAATAALLNEAYFKDGYPPYGSVTELVNAVNATLATQDEAKYVAMAAELDWWNNGVH